MFDLDGTLVNISQKAFIDTYFKLLLKVFHGLGMDADLAGATVWEGTKAMALNDGTTVNANRFWQVFSKRMQLTDEQTGVIEEACDSFYSNEFNAVKSVMKPSDIPARLVRELANKGYSLVLATNPMFPLCALESRLGWIGLRAKDFQLVTHYYNSTFCKPNPGYYQEIYGIINKTPEQCLMIGNNPAEDMVAGDLGSETFLVTDCLENESDIDISGYRHGSLAELEGYLGRLPDIYK